MDGKAKLFSANKYFKFSNTHFYRRVIFSAISDPPARINHPLPLVYFDSR
jgi:hypothetical protein